VVRDDELFDRHDRATLQADLARIGLGEFMGPCRPCLMAVCSASPCTALGRPRDL
jgi:hypothetical protein